MSTEQQILDAYRDIFLGIPEVNTVLSEEMKLNIADFKNHELPAIQFDSIQEIVVDFKRYQDLCNLSIIVELCTKRPNYEADKIAFRALKNKIIDKVIEKPTLGLADIVRNSYNGFNQDIHADGQPHLLAMMNFTVQYYRKSRRC